MPFCGNCGSPGEGKFCAKCGAPLAAPAAGPAAGPPTPIPAPVPPPAAAPPPFTEPPPYSPVYAPPPQQPPPQKSNTLKYFLFGCLGLIVLGALITLAITMFIAKKAKDAGFDADLATKNPAVAAVKMMAAVNPDVDVVSVDEGKETITLRQKSTGKTITLHFEDVKQGRISFSDESGESTVNIGTNWKPPSWVPLYPGAKAAAGASAESSTEDAGGGGLTTADSAEQVVSYYESELKKEGLTVSKNTIGTGTESITTLIGHDDRSGKNVNVIVAPEGAETKVQLSYSRKR